jgi:hypothetical protein
MSEKLIPGVYFEHAIRNTTELDLDTIALAETFGFDPNVDVIAAARAGLKAMGDINADVSMALAEVASDAVGFLNENACPDGYWVGNDGEVGAFGVWELPCVWCGDASKLDDAVKMRVIEPPTHPGEVCEEPYHDVCARAAAIDLVI